MRKAAGVMLDTAAERGEEGHRAFAAVEEVLQEGGEAQVFLRWYGDSAPVGIDHDAGVGDALRRVLSFVVAEAQAERVGETMPERLGAPRGAGRLRADGAVSEQACAGRVRRGLGDEDSVVDPDDGIEGLAV
jgi:hypothetical protein